MALLKLVKDRVRRLLLLQLRWGAGYDRVVSLENRIFGRKLRLEVCSACQLACPSCTTAQGKTKCGTVGWGTLRAEDFRRFVETNGRIRLIEISNWGEIFLNRELPEILAIAHARGIAIEAMNGVNLNTAREDALEAVVRYGLRRMSVSIDGATAHTYARYRKNGDLNRVLEHIDRINRHKAAYRSRYPELTWQFIVFGHNEHEIAAARAMAKARDMHFNPIRNLDFDYSPVDDPALVKRETGIDATVAGEEVVRGFAERFDFCHQLWDAPQVNWDGKLLGCCFNNYTDFGNVFEIGLPAALAGEGYRNTKQFLLGRAEPRHDTPCVQCPVYIREPRPQGRVIPITPADSRRDEVLPSVH